LNQPLSPLALAAIDLLDVDSPSYALDVVSIVESIVEDPRTILSAQKFKARGEAVQSMKSEGIEYDERMELLDDVTYPKPLEELLQVAYGSYRQGHPWVDDYQLSPKSVVRDMYERAMNFVEYVNFYSLARSEGLVLRYLTDAYDTLRHTVPDEAKTETLQDLIEWLGELVRQVDSSLLDEWESLRNPDEEDPHAPVRLPDGPPPVTRNERAFRVLVRNQLFRRVEFVARQAYYALGELDAASGWDAAAWEDAMADYFDEYKTLGIGPDARGPALLMIEKETDIWRVRQIFDDPAGDHDWGISAEVDLAASNEAGTAVLTVTGVNRL
jgi:hypothetical protein